MGQEAEAISAKPDSRLLSPESRLLTPALCRPV